MEANMATGNELFEMFQTGSWQSIVRSLRGSREVYFADPGVDSLDVRLCVREDGSWFTAIGDVSYDTEHTAYCGAGYLGRNDNDADLKITALDLISQVVDQIAEGE